MYFYHRAQHGHRTCPVPTPPTHAPHPTHSTLRARQANRASRRALMDDHETHLQLIQSLQTRFQQLEALAPANLQETAAQDLEHARLAMEQYKQQQEGLQEEIKVVVVGGWVGRVWCGGVGWGVQVVCGG